MNRNKIISILIPAVVLVIVGISNLSSPKDRLADKNTSVPNQTQERKVGKAIYLIENSGSMFGYVQGGSKYVDVLTELSEKPRFVEEITPREFYFVNGGQKIVLTKIGTRPSALKDKLTQQGFNCGDPTRSNLNAMFQKALSMARKDTITILISDGIYDIGNHQDPLTKLSIEGRETRSKFIERLNDGDFQSIIIKLNSQFVGNYFPSTGNTIRIDQERPYYIWVFGESGLLNEYFPEDYIKSLKGYRDVARFINMNDTKLSHQIVAHDKKGNFKFDKINKNKLIDIELDRRSGAFQFTIAVDYSELPFSNSYLCSVANYTCNNSNYSVTKVNEIGPVKVYGLNFQPTHLISVFAEKSPFGHLNVSLKNTVPYWISETNIDNEARIIGDSVHTYGFKFLTDAISEAYQYKSKEANIYTFSFELLN